MSRPRKIIHIDMDCFYAAVEIRDQPELAAKPVAVGGASSRGVITTCNYVARQFGIHSAMPGFKAREKCPHLIFLPVRFDLYRTESSKIRAILDAYSPLVEPISLDEAYVDVSHHNRYAWSIAREMRKRIFETTQLTASAGIAPNKMLAKIASDWKKPNSQFAITPDQIESFMATLPINKIWGVGPKSVEKFNTMGIKTCGQLQAVNRTELIRRFGRWGEELYHLCRGVDNRPVISNRPRKSLSNERTYSDLLHTIEDCQSAMRELVCELNEELISKSANRNRGIRKVFVKVKFSDFTRTTKECLCPQPAPEIFQRLLHEAFYRKKLPARLLGAGVRFTELEPHTSGHQEEWNFE